MIETARLRLSPLTAEQLALWLDDLPGLEKALGCTYRAEPLDGHFRKIIEAQRTVTQSDPGNALWHTFWWILRKQDGVVVGSADFKGVPDRDGSVEIGYGLGSAFEHRGYMTEAVRALCAWGLSQPGVRLVTAETERDNVASQRVLARCGFTRDARAPGVWWRLTAPPQQRPPEPGDMPPDCHGDPTKKGGVFYENRPCVRFLSS